MTYKYEKSLTSLLAIVGRDMSSSNTLDQSLLITKDILMIT